MKKYFVLLALLTLTVSCKKWLDIKPQSEVSEDDLFSTEDGFKDAVNGLYSRCTQEDLYGRELMGGLPDVLAQNYTLPALDQVGYKEASLYNYKNKRLIERKDQAWKGLYEVIANCNIILSQVDKKQGLLSPVNYNLVKGEALAMRAYCHFDVLRLFAPAAATGATAKAIPYVTAFTKKSSALLTVTAVLDSALQDLLAAKMLLVKSDPILQAGYKVGYPIKDSSSEDAGEMFVQQRRHRLNYYAVCGELARVYLYKNDKTNALLYAREVINAGKFPWTRQEDFLNGDDEKKDRILYKELLFGFYMPNRSGTLNDMYRRGENNSLVVSSIEGQNIYETGGVGGDDFRFKQWFSEQPGSNGNYLQLDKYKRDGDANIHYQMGPAIRLSEIYYIAAECSFAASPKQAWDYFNEVRLHRGIGPRNTNEASAEVFYTELVKEARKEFYGEGQVFYMYKRLNRAITGANGKLIPAANSIFVLPLPDDEIAYGNR
ncbi:RagB/SusD family nutrient uptake outer membrane protein [Chitinophaga sp. 22321]|uniref:RagB/SusD family nutrient uptake outer membrane protein n=1 Tax=Chitinophaga hostae TaxID=2831022 RepID=A0ABS5J8S1_9BACT|nr:RagB/SusD family nutrient uptake outer membrane protein [Chitinophaga hostae]MBS0031491.1 RagB/SusD family nutrient uptake outer membrane protein [Chitinophaga hostae]